MAKEYYAPSRVLFGNGVENQAGKLLKEFGATKVLVHFGTGSVKKSGLLDRVEEALKAEGLAFVELGGVIPNPRLSLVNEGIELCKKEGVDFILAVGGGSVIDSAKAIGYGVFGGGDVWDFYCGKRVIEGTVPVGVILTLSATGSEMSDSSVITNDLSEITYKRGVSSRFGRVKFSLLAPNLTYTVSPYQTGSGSVDIIMHTFERFFQQGYALDLTDEVSFAVIKTVMKYAPIAIETPDDYDARANLMWASTLSHNGLTDVGSPTRGDWACHQIEHELSAEYDVAHGAGLAAVWGSWARFVLDTNPARFAKLGKGLFGFAWDENTDLATTKRVALDTIEAMEEFFVSIGMPIGLKSLGLDFDDAACMNAALGVTFQDTRKVGNFVELTSKEICEIYKMAKDK